MWTRFWSRPYMEVKTALAFLFYALLFCMMSTDATVTMHLYSFYTAHFSIILHTASDKNDRFIVYTGYNFRMKNWKKKWRMIVSCIVSMYYDWLMYWVVSNSQLAPRRTLGHTLLFYQSSLLLPPFVLRPDTFSRDRFPP